MQGSTEGRLPPKDIQGVGGGCTHNVTQQTDTHTREGGRTHSVTKRTDTQGGTHPQCNPTNRHTHFFATHTRTRQSHILRQHAA